MPPNLSTYAEGQLLTHVLPRNAHLQSHRGEGDHGCTTPRIPSSFMGHRPRDIQGQLMGLQQGHPKKHPVLYRGPLRILHSLWTRYPHSYFALGPTNHIVVMWHPPTTSFPKPQAQISVTNTFASEGVQNMLPQNMPHWYIDYFESKPLEKLQMLGKAFSEPPLFA